MRGGHRVMVFGYGSVWARCAFRLGVFMGLDEKSSRSLCVFDGPLPGWYSGRLGGMDIGRINQAAKRYLPILLWGFTRSLPIYLSILRSTDTFVTG